MVSPVFHPSCTTTHSSAGWLFETRGFQEKKEGKTEGSEGEAA